MKYIGLPQTSPRRSEVENRKGSTMDEIFI